MAHPWHIRSTPSPSTTVRRNGEALVNRPERSDPDQLYHRMAAAGLGPSRIRCAHVVLHRAVVQAVRWGWLPRNPMSDATRPEVPRVTVVPLDVDQVRELLAAAREQDPLLAS